MRRSKRDKKMEYSYDNESYEIQDNVSGKNRKIDGMKHRRSVKITVFIVLILSAALLFGSVLSASVMWDCEIFTSSKDEVETEFREDLTYTSGQFMLSEYILGSLDFLELYCGEFYSLEFEVISGITPYKTEGAENLEHLLPYEQTYVWGEFIDWSLLEVVSHTSEENYYSITSENDQIAKLLEGILFTEGEINEFENKQYFDYEIKTIVYIDQTYPVIDTYYIQQKVIDSAYAIAPFIWYIIALSFILCCVLFIFLLISAGYRVGHKERILCGTARIPYELYLVPMFFFGGVGFIVFANACYDFAVGYLTGAVYGVLGVAMLGTCITSVLMDFVVRVSTGTVFSSLIIVRILKWLRPFTRCKSGVNRFGKFSVEIVKEIPTIGKGILIYAVVSVLVFLIILPYWLSMRFMMWILANILILPMFIYVCLMLKRLQLASKALGEGNLSYEVDTKYSLFEFKEMGESLNSIAIGMEHAVEEKMKSERLKTELISNVSHDIKTPLTSIINYADLIQKEDTENEKIKEYSEILLRQSDRLRRLTEDLVHASKVTTGNVEVQLAPCNIGVLFSQAIGEFEEKMASKELKIILKEPEEEVIIEADGRHMWRIFDNLLNNICKYAQEGTRVYLILQKIEDEIYITFKNISKYELNISEEELMERFVRGDKSRHSEGNGLGLSIAKSLVEVQGGSMRVAIDGDLFKVVLNF